MTPLEALGIISALLALLAFVLNEYGILDKDDISYDALNLVSGVGLFYYAYAIHGVPFMITNAVWALVSGIDVARYFLKKGRAVKSGR